MKMLNPVLAFLMIMFTVCFIVAVLIDDYGAHLLIAFSGGFLMSHSLRILKDKPQAFQNEHEEQQS